LKFQNKRRIKDKVDNQKHFCNSTIKGAKTLLDDKKYNFFLIETHYEICLKIKINKNTHSTSEIKKKL